MERKTYEVAKRSGQTGTGNQKQRCRAMRARPLRRTSSTSLLSSMKVSSACEPSSLGSQVSSNSLVSSAVPSPRLHEIVGDSC